MSLDPRHERFMAECLRLARKGRGTVSPNPLVGAALVVQNSIVARGWHRRCGGPHAEVECLRNYDGSTKGATLYINLEPCAHYGKTPPCVDLILQRGIMHVVVAMKDPNPLVAGRGITRLRRNGVNVTLGPLEAEARELNRFFVRHISSKRPYVHIKVAQTLDGFIARRRGKLEYLTSPESRKLVHEWRAEYDAVLVGAGTVASDNPQLNVRLARGRDPNVVILDGQLTLTGNEQIFSNLKRRKAFVLTIPESLNASRAVAARFLKKGITIVPIASASGRITPGRILNRLYALGIGSLLVEGGSSVFSQFIKKGFVDELSLFYAPIRFGNGITAFTSAAERRLHGFIGDGVLSTKEVGNDLLLNFRRRL